MFIDTFVLVETLVLGGDERIAQLLWDLRERNPNAALVLLEHFGEAAALAVEHNACAGKPQALEFVVVRQIRHRLIVEIDDVAEIDGRLCHRLVLAELLIPRLQIGKIDAAQRLAPADGLRIVHRGRDQFIDIDVFELERLEHVDAARVQEPCDLRLIPVTVEFGLHSVG